MTVRREEESGIEMETAMAAWLWCCMVEQWSEQELGIYLKMVFNMETVRN